MKPLLKLLFSSLLILASVSIYAENISVEEMRATCLTGFMKDADKASDVDAYKSYVNNLCECTGNKVGGREITDQAEVMAGMGSCMKLSLLTETMNSLKDDETINEDKISAGCMNEWKIFTSMKTNQGTLEKYCSCAAKAIMAQDKNKRGESELDQISMNCVDKDS